MTKPIAARRVVLALALASAALLAAVTAAPASAFVSWAHGGLPATYDPSTCAWCHGDDGMSPATDESCTWLCHRGFAVAPEATVDGRFPETCWSCHAPGADTTAFASSSAACSQECHLYSPVTKQFTVAYSHGTSPHLGAAAPYGECLDCHTTSVGWTQPGGSPHHDGRDAEAPTCERCHDGVIAGARQAHDGARCGDCHDGMDRPATPAACVTCHAAATFGSTDCLTCHRDQVHDAAPDVGTCTSCHDGGYQQHAGKVACTACHTNTPRLHHGTAAAAVKTCRACHPMKHAGVKVGGARCAGCHKGSSPPARPRAQHSATVTRKAACSGCHGQKLHAAARGARTTCRSCHKGRYHAAQAKVASAACLTCHRGARSHSGGFACVRCHRAAVHDRTP